MAKISVIGSGAWGITLAKLLCETGNTVSLWCHDQHIAQEINTAHTFSSVFENKLLPLEITATTDLSAAAKNAEAVVLVVASHFYREVLQSLKAHLTAEQLIISATKGLEEKTYQRMSEVAAAVFGERIRERYVVLSGPNLSKEIMNNLPAAAVVASENMESAEKAQVFFNSALFRTYTHTDVVGVELGGTLKNVIAIAAGICDGFNLGDNAKAALMVRGAAEMARLAIALGAQAQTLMGLSGMGDLITTCSSSLSRNHLVGEQLARGKKLNEILKNMQAVAEGVTTAKVALDVARQNKVAMPITEQVCEVLFNNKNPQAALADLMARDPRSEKE